MTNSTKSAFFIAKLKPPFFSRFKPLGETNVEKRRGVRCQLYAKVGRKRPSSSRYTLLDSIAST